MPQHHHDTGSDYTSTLNRLRIHDLLTPANLDQAAFAKDVAAGLARESKQLSPKYFYDELGSQLFEAICLLPEYYLTRAETEILTRRADEVIEMIGVTDNSEVSLLELGSGSAQKTRTLIDALLKRQNSLRYVPIDISTSALEVSSRSLLQAYPALHISAYATDYDSALAHLGTATAKTERRGRMLALFLGSNIGNLNRGEAQQLLSALRHNVLRNSGDGLLIGVDLKKEKFVLEAAYDDQLGVTAAFNLNLLARINRELNADFDVRAFKHVAIYNEEAGRVEAYLESLRTQTARIRTLNLEVDFTAGERIHTESSYKYDLAELSQLAVDTGFTRAHTWLDEAARFSSNLFLVA